MSVDLVVFGNLIVDDIVYDDGRTRMAQPGGAVLYMGLTGVLWGIEVGLVSIAGEDFPRRMLDELASRGIDLAGVRRSGEPGLRTWLLYEGHLRRVVHRLEGATHAQASPRFDDLPQSWRPRAVHLAPMPFDLQLGLAAALSSRFDHEVLLSLDPFELLTDERRPQWRQLLSRLDLFFLSEDELASREARKRPEEYLRSLIGGRLHTLLLKRGDRGGLVLRAGASSPLSWPGRADAVLDSTGAGDAFACGVLAALLRDRPLARALEWGVVSASFALEGQGASGLLKATPATAEDRLQRWFGT